MPRQRLTHVDLTDVTRVEFINHSSIGQQGRLLVHYSNEAFHLEFDLQDQGRTLKIFRVDN